MTGARTSGSATLPATETRRLKPRIVLSINTAWNVYNFRRGLIAALQEAGYEVVVTSPEDGFVDKLLALGCRHRPVPMAVDTTSVLDDLRLLFAYSRLFRAERPAVYLGYTIKPNVYGTLAARLCRVPVVNNVSGLGTAFIRETWLTRVVTVLYRLAFKGSHTVFFQNGDDRGHFVERRIVEHAKTRVLPGSGIDLGHYLPVPLPSEQHREIEGRALPLAMQAGDAKTPQTAEQACPADGRRRGRQGDRRAAQSTCVSIDRPQPDEVSGHPPGTPVFVLVARLLWDKGVGEFVEAARIVRRHRQGVRFQLLGFLDVENRTAVDRASVERWVAEGVVEYLGSTNDVRPFIAAADCVVLPSYREGTPKSLLEGAAMGRPLIATDVPGCREVVEDGVNGVLCRVRDAADLAEKMLELVDLSPEARAAMGRAGRAKVERQFDERIVIDRYLEVIAEILAPATAPVTASVPALVPAIAPPEVIADILIPATAPVRQNLPPIDRVAKSGGESL
jgi:glycosyltransferase involved in cell wall biosynthesis